MKKYLAFVGSAMFFVVCVSLYLMLESSTNSMQATKLADLGYGELSNIEAKIKDIEGDLVNNRQTISKIKDIVQEMANGDVKSLQKLKNVLKMGNVADGAQDSVHKMQQGAAVKAAVAPPVNKKSSAILAVVPPRQTVKIPPDMCSLSEAPSPQKIDVQMLDALNSIKFDNPDGGVWKQGWAINYDTTQWTAAKPLKIFIIPHSHTDPGWIKTFARYYTDQTRHILNNMVDKLEEDSRRKFMYAEMSFFYQWWNEIDAGKRARVKKLIEKGQFELVTGGWVMTDEATAHYFGMLDQMIEGNQWLENHLGFKPKSAWAIDPFGHSPTMAYLLRRMGFKNMLIQRVHYAVKKLLAQTKKLEFMWRQTWDQQGDTQILTHMMPFYSYDVPHTCGPDPKICCQFDFKRLAGGKLHCPWKVPPQPIHDGNVAQRAELLLDQYRKKAQLYRNNMLLVPVGDDFRYDKPVEWDQQYGNYQRLMDYMNNKKDWNVQIQFGTLSDYFTALYERAGVKEGVDPPSYPILSGDFYTYADRDDHYWSGYFTSRPFYKALDRIMEDHLRGAEILYSVAVAQARHHKAEKFPYSKLMKYMVNARRSLALFQHHDGITGTAKDFVVVDYGNRLLTAMMDMKKVMTDSAQYLLLQDKNAYAYNDGQDFFHMDEKRASHDSLPEKTIMQLDTKPRNVVYYNSLAQAREEIVRLYVSHPHVEVKDSSGKVVESQVDPFWDNNENYNLQTYKLVFTVKVPAVGLSLYTVAKTADNANPKNHLSEVTMYNGGQFGSAQSGIFRIEKKSAAEFSIENSFLKASFGTNMMLQTTSNKEEGWSVKTEVSFMMYGTRNARDKSGAYLFLPDGPAQPLLYNNPFTRVVRGPLVQEVHVFVPHVEHVVRLHNSPGASSSPIDVYNIVDLRGEMNREIIMRVTTDIKNPERQFYSDLNGFQMLKRRTLDKVPLQANFYPLTTQAYLEDGHSRFSVLSAQSLGVASLQQGWMEIVMDRRLNQDDNRGLGQGVLDNKRTPNRFRFLIEKRLSGSKTDLSQPTGYPSILSHTASLQLIHPIYTLAQRQEAASQGAKLLPQFSALQNSLPCEVHLLNLRTLQNPEDDPVLKFVPKDTMALVLHRLGVDCAYPAKGVMCVPGSGKVSLGTFLKDLKIEKVTSTSLSLLHDKHEVAPSSTLTILPMEIEAYRIKVQ